VSEETRERAEAIDAGIPQIVDEDAVTRALTIDGVDTRELPAASEVPEPADEAITAEFEPHGQTQEFELDEVEPEFDDDPELESEVEAEFELEPEPESEIATEVEFTLDPTTAETEIEPAADIKLALVSDSEPEPEPELESDAVFEVERMFASDDEDEDSEDDDYDNLAEELGLEDRAEPEPEPRPRVRHPPKTIVGMLRPNGAVILLGLLCALAVVESLAAFLEYREGIADDDWEVVERMLALHEDEPVIIASEWLGPTARMRLSKAQSADSLAYPDLRGFERFWLLSHTRERPWRGALRAELEELRRPQLLAVHRVGELLLHEYRHDTGAVLYSLLDPGAIEGVSTARGRCTGDGDRYRCKEGHVRVRVLEIDYRPRRCLGLELDDGVMARVDLGEIELGERFYGHVGFGDFNDRLRADPVALLELWIDDAVAGRWVFTDDQGWASFALATPPGRHHVRLEIGTTFAGTWQRDGHRSTPTDTLCVELRAFAAPTLAPASEQAGTGDETGGTTP
jgi:hypothetical protein